MEAPTLQLQFSKDLKPGRRIFTSPPGANGKEVRWRASRGKGGAVVVVFTINGNPAGVTLAPPEANDIHELWVVHHDEHGLYEKIEFYWSSDGKRLPKPIPTPRGTDDMHFFILPGRGGQPGRIVKAWWTKDGKRVQAIPVPAGANDYHSW